MEEFVWINGKPLCQFGGRLLATYEVGQSTLSFERSDSPAGSGFIISSRQIGLRTIKLPIHIFGDTPEETQEKVSHLLQEFITGKTELALPDGFIYFAVLSGQEGPVLITEEIASLTLTLSGIRCKPMRTEQGHTFHVDGTLPQMDCILRVTAGQTADRYTIAGITFGVGDQLPGVTLGDQIVIDGINKRVTVNGMDAVNRCDIVAFPQVHPGINELDAPDPVTLEYYPTYL